MLHRKIVPRHCVGNYDRNMTLNYIVEDSIRSGKSFNETLNGLGNVTKTHTSNGLFDFAVDR
ncbi:MAG: hypothetical protein LBE12_06060 [Planctomycetaceae bacterium]|jgi:hypothetical protein|nr:hypothetical protein [Planctomycetaceae bacterium]